MPRYHTIRPKRLVNERTLVGRDDAQAYVVRRDMSGGQNNRQTASVIGENQAKVLKNIDISVPGQRVRRPGLTLLEDLGSNAITGLFFYDPQGNTANLLATEGTNLKRWPTSGSFSSVSTAFTTGLDTKMIKAYKTGVGDVALISNGTDNVYEMAPDYTMTDLGDTSTSPPKTPVMTFYRNRPWFLKSDLLYFGGASPSNYATTFDRTTNFFRIPVGEERALLATRDLGLIIAGKEQIWALNPSNTPTATDLPEKILDQGVAAGDTFIQAGDDYIGLFFDGVRALKRTVQDKIQFGESQPLSFPIKEEVDSLAWGSITKACAVYWDNKYIISVPVNGSSYNNQVWVYYPATNAWMIITGWNVAKFAKVKVNGKELLYAGEATADGKVYRAWFGASDNGTAIDFLEEGRNEDLGYPLVKKIGGELKVVGKPVGNYDIAVYGSFDNSAYVLLGYLNVNTNLTSFPITFPVTFYQGLLSYEKFHLDNQGPWYTFRHKFEHNAVTTNAEDITIYEHSLTATLEEYISEEQQ